MRFHNFCFSLFFYLFSKPPSNTLNLRNNRIVQGTGYSLNINPAAPVVQLVTSKPSDVGTWVRISVQSHELRFFLTKIQKIYNQIMPPTSRERLIRGYTKFKFDFTVDEGKGMAASFSREKLRQAPQKEGGETLCDLPPV